VKCETKYISCEKRNKMAAKKKYKALGSTSCYKSTPFAIANFPIFYLIAASFIFLCAGSLLPNTT